MQPNQPFQPYGQQPLAPNPYAQQVPIQPVKFPSTKPVGLIISLVMAIMFLFGALGFGLWAFASRQDYKNNVDKKISAAVVVAKQQEASVKDTEFAEREKQPLKPYKGAATYGSVGLAYPKTWSAFITESNSGSTPLDGYFHPNYVPGLQSGTGFALRVQVTQQQYANEVKQYESLAKQGKVKITAYKAPKVPNVTGSRIDGEIAAGQTGSMVLFPLRDKTIKISTQSAQFVNDFNNFILNELTFEP